MECYYRAISPWNKHCIGYPLKADTWRPYTLSTQNFNLLTSESSWIHTGLQFIIDTFENYNFQKYMNIWNRIESSQVSMYIYGQLIFNKVPRPLNREKKESLQQMVLGQLGIQVKNEVGTLPSPHTKINSKWINNLNIRAKTIKCLDTQG